MFAIAAKDSTASRRAEKQLRLAVALLAILPAACGPSDPGERVWNRKCAGCHGVDGRARTKFAIGRPFADLSDGRWKHGPARADIRRLVRDGEPQSPMPPYEGRLSEPEIDAVVDHVLKLAGAPGSSPATPPSAAR